MERAEHGDEGAGLTGATLRERWRSRSMRAGWAFPADWWTPAVEAVCEAVATWPESGRDLVMACRRLGLARGRSGAGIGETLDDLGALFDVLDWTDPPLALVREVAEGWVETGLAGFGADSCEDPLTGLATLAYLRSRLAEIYRAAAVSETPVSAAYRLVMVDLSDGSPPWWRLARLIVAGADLRTVFDGGETLTLVGAGTAAVLVTARPELEFQTAGLRRVLGGPSAARVWTERLPDSCEKAFALLAELAGAD